MNEVVSFCEIVLLELILNYYLDYYEASNVLFGLVCFQVIPLSGFANLDTLFVIFKRNVKLWTLSRILPDCSLSEILDWNHEIRGNFFLSSVGIVPEVWSRCFLLSSRPNASLLTLYTWPGNRKKTVKPRNLITIWKIKIYYYFLHVKISILPCNWKKK